MLYPSYRPPAAQTANSTRYLQGLTFAGGTTIDEEGHKLSFARAPRAEKARSSPMSFDAVRPVSTTPVPVLCA
jgi:hypothetical protein